KASATTPKRPRILTSDPHENGMLSVEAEGAGDDAVDALVRKSETPPGGSPSQLTRSVAATTGDAQPHASQASSQRTSAEASSSSSSASTSSLGIPSEQGSPTRAAGVVG